MCRILLAPPPRWRPVATAAALLLPLALAACSRSPVVMGQRPAGAPAAIRALDRLSPQSAVVVSGVMVEKCPVAGCWFVLRDGTGQVRVDTKTAGFVVTDVPLKTRLTVAGSVQREEGTTSLAAIGALY